MHPSYPFFVIWFKRGAARSYAKELIYIESFAYLTEKQSIWNRLLCSGEQAKKVSVILYNFLIPTHFEQPVIDFHYFP